MTEVCIQFPAKRSLGSLYTAEKSFPHARKWVGEARGPVNLNMPEDRMLGVALGAFGWEALPETNTSDLKCLKSIDFSTAQFCEKTARAITVLNDLSEMRLDFLNVSDADLAHIKDFVGLKTLWLTGTPVTDRGLAALAPLVNLANLVLKSTKVTDAGLQQLKSLPLKSLTLPTQISNAGLANVYAISTLQRLDASNTAVTDAGLAGISALKNLEELYLTDTKITDACIEHILPLPSLKTLFLSGTGVTDKSVAQFETLDKLEHLELRDTRVTEIATARLRAKLPKCGIFGG